MLILGIESSCDETAASLLEIEGKKFQPEIKVLSNVISSQIKIHARYGGVVPEVAARNHIENIIPVIKNSIKNSRFKIQDVDLIAVTSGPGLVTSLRVGVDTAKTLAYALKKPLIGVNHIEGHIYSNWLKPIEKFPNSKFKIQNSVKFPALILVVSGGHTELVLMKNHGNYEIIGETRDDAAGEAFDKVAKILGLGYPGGPIVSKIADNYKLKAISYKLSLPRPMIDSPSFDFSFAGLKTAVLYRVRDLTKQHSLNDLVGPIAHEFQNAAVETLISKTVNAAKKLGVKSILLAGGVSANKKLRADLGHAVASQIPNSKFYVPKMEYTTDNATMIALAGYFNYIRSPKQYKNGWKNIKVNPNMGL